MPYIYKITNKINNKIYIGKTNFTIEKRWKEHCRDCKKQRKEKRPLYEAMIKYGIENFSIEEIEECSLEQANEREKYWIERLSSFKFGYNATIGGDGKHYIDYNLILSLFKEGYNIKEISKLTNHDCGHISLILTNMGISREEKEKRRMENVKKHYKPIIQKTLDGELIKVHESIAAAYRFIDKRYSSHITEVCKGKRKQAYGYRWEFLEREVTYEQKN